ncbi:MAG: hypothetical protein LV479_04445 [Methylacidiphilales bacterium]|nr:hypothetical protein [Candidatus Methylacidiphilales bacterium]
MAFVRWYALALGLGTFVAVPSRGELVDFHFGAVTQTGPAVLGNPGDQWNSNNNTNGGPQVLNDVNGQPTSITLSWTSGASWDPTKPIFCDPHSSAMDAATTWLMQSYASSYQYTSGPTNLVLNLSGLSPNTAYTLVLLAAGDQKNEGTAFTVYGTGTFTGATTGLSRKISQGPGVAYVTMSVVSSSTGTLQVTAVKNTYYYAVVNGFQLYRSHAWGIVGHPTENDYANWTPANITTQVNYLKQLSVGYYRCSFDGTSNPVILDNIAPATQAAGISVLPILPLSLVAANTAQVNYNTNYQTAYNWATYAILKGYNITYWELGNELENDGLVNVVYDGASPNQYPDAMPGGFVAIASGLSGAYQGIKDAYSTARLSGLTTIAPQVLYGATYRHWGLLAKIQNYNGTLPCDLISWHWYGPNYGSFTAPIADSKSFSNGRTPVQCLNDFKSKVNPSQPMDIWITETDRSAYVSGQGLLNGSCASNTTPTASQDWAAQATAIQQNIDSFKTVPSVKGIFVYELLDETIMNGGSTAQLAAEGYFGLVTKLNGTLKNGFYTFQTEISQDK